MGNFLNIAHYGCGWAFVIANFVAGRVFVSYVSLYNPNEVVWIGSFSHSAWFSF